jgi:hypothetical protein
MIFRFSKTSVLPHRAEEKEVIGGPEVIVTNQSIAKW